MNTRQTIKSATIILRVTPGERRALEIINAREGIGTLSDTARKLLREGYERRMPALLGINGLVTEKMTEQPQA
jgi:hypothetical protein